MGVGAGDEPVEDECVGEGFDVFGGVAGIVPDGVGDVSKGRSRGVS